MKPGHTGKAKSRLKQRKKRRCLGAREYKNYSQEMLQLAVELVENGQLSARAAARQFSIPKQTILNKTHNKHNKSVGSPPRLTAEEESKLVKVLIAAAKFGSPLTKLDLRLVVFNYLRKNGRQDLFEDQPPGKAWVDNFLLRNAADLTVRSTQNIKTARAEKNVDEFMTYFENLRETIKDVPASNILNFDETNLSDNPGNSKCIFRRGVKYPERVLNSTKGAISIMFSGTAAGEILPVYVVYKAENLYSEWIQGGPRDARYNHTKSGWFDSQTFEDYFTRIVLDWASGLPGKKVVICDNLSSHLSVDVVELCESHDIEFVFLPANSTHLTQPLDVAFFGPLKKVWRRILLQYKIENPNQTTLNKNHFPKLLKSLTEQIQLTELKNIKSGFKATGISPFNPREVLKRIPEYHEDLGSYTIDEALLDYLKQTRQPKPMISKRNKKVVTEPGKSVTVNDFLRQETNAPRSSVTSVRSGVTTSKNSQLNTKKYKKSGNSHKLVDNDKNDVYEMDMIVDEQMELTKETENVDITDNIDMDMTQFLEDILEDGTETENGDLTDAKDLTKFPEKSLEDDVKEMNLILDEKTGLLEMKGKTMDKKLPGNKNNENKVKVLSSVTLNLPSTSTGKTGLLEMKGKTMDKKLPGNKNNENKVKVLSSVTLNLPSTSTGKTNKSDLWFRPQYVLHSDSDEELQNIDKENVMGEIRVKIKNEKKEGKCIYIPREKYKDCKTKEEILAKEDKILIQKIKPIKSVASVRSGVTTSKNSQLNTKKYKKSGNSHKLVDNDKNDVYEMDMIVDEQMELTKETENVDLTDNIDMDMTQFLEDILEDGTETENGDLTDAKDLTKFPEKSLEDDVKEMNLILDEKTGLLEMKGKTMDNTKKYKKSGNSHKLVDNDENDVYEMDMIVDEQMELIKETENGDLTDNIDMDMTQFLEDILEDGTETENGDLSDAKDLTKFPEKSLEDDVKEMNLILDEKTGQNNENKVKVLSTVTLNLPSTSTGKTNKSDLWFRPHVLHSDSDEELQNIDKENVMGEIQVKIKNEKKEGKCIYIPREKYKDCETKEEILAKEDKILIQKIKPIKTSKNDKNCGKNSKKQKECKRLARNSSDSETDVSDNISYRESSDSETYIPEDVEADVEMSTTEFNEYSKTISDPVENEELLDHHVSNDVYVDRYVLVKFMTKKSSKHYVGKVTKVDGILVTINFLRKKKNNTFSWPQAKDESEMYLFDIVKVLPQPIESRRGTLKFETDFSELNVF